MNPNMNETFSRCGFVNDIIIRFYNLFIHSLARHSWRANHSTLFRNQMTSQECGCLLNNVLLIRACETHTKSSLNDLFFVLFWFATKQSKATRKTVVKQHPHRKHRLTFISSNFSFRYINRHRSAACSFVVACWKLCLLDSSIDTLYFATRHWDGIFCCLIWWLQPELVYLRFSPCVFLSSMCVLLFAALAKFI